MQPDDYTGNDLRDALLRRELNEGADAPSDERALDWADDEEERRDDGA